MPQSHPPYPPKYRAEAARLVRDGGRSPAQLAQDLGCSDQTIRDWVRQTDLDAGRRHDDLTTTEQDELRRPRAENRLLRIKRALVKKAAAFFAKENDPIQ